MIYYLKDEVRYYKNGGRVRKMQTAAGGPLRPISYLDSFEPEWKKEYKKGIQKIPEITVTGKKRYVMSADPDHQTKFIGAMVGPFKNLLSPTQGARLVYDTGKALSGDMSFTDWSKSLMENNNGIVTDEFAEEHPYLSTGINLVGDGISFGKIASNLSKTPGVYYHGSPTKGLTTLEPRNGLLWVTDSKSGATLYGGGITGKGSLYKINNIDLGDNILTVNGKFHSPFKVPLKDLPEDVLDYLPKDKYTYIDKIANAARLAGYSSVLFKNVLDFGGKGASINPFHSYTYKQTAVFNPINITSESVSPGILGFKQGGKMNAIEQFKQGHKIHIKKKNRGKFTAYCGGNVTSACIAKAKASGNPTLVKRATFAANARKWKHLKGGIIKALTGILLGPAPNITRKPIVKEILSYLPITGSVIDTETAIKNPTLSNIGWATWSVGSDILGGRILRDLLEALKAYKETKAVTKAAEEALDTHRKTTKNIIAHSVREEDQKLINALQKAKELEALKWGELYWNKAITYPVYGGWIANDAGINYLLNHKNGGIIKAETGLSTNSFIDPMIVDYIKAIENPDRVGWNGKVWKAPGLKGYDLNLRGYGIDINTNNAARKLTAGRKGQWLTDDEANTLMLDHIRYIMNAANKHIKGFGELPIGRKAALLGMLYRGDSVNKSNINIAEPDDTKFFNSVHNYYISKGLRERANNSSKFFKSYENSNNTIPNFNFNNYKDLNYPFKYIQ